MKKLFAFLFGLLMAGSIMATNYAKVTTTPSSWDGEYVLAAVVGDSTMVWTGIDAGQCKTAIATTSDTLAFDEVITITVEALTTGYSIKVNGGANDGTYISSGTSKPTYANGLKFVAVATQVDFDFVAANNTVTMTQTITGNTDSSKNGTVYLLYNKASGASNERFRFYKSTNYQGNNYVTPYLYKKLADDVPTANNIENNEVTKKLVNGKLVIIKDNTQYNIYGQVNH